MITVPIAGGLARTASVKPVPIWKRLPSAVSTRSAPIIPVWVRREPNNVYVAEVEAPLEVSRTGDMARDIQVTTERIVQFFERIIRREPDQWLVFLPVWRPQAQPVTPEPPMQAVLDPS